jgi:membrane protein
MVGIGTATLYRFGPSRNRAQWQWLSWGASIATVVWLISSWGFSYYLQNFADYNATYGALGAMIGFMMWTWISIIILLVGAELNAELEHQTTKDTTTGAPEPMGNRGAFMADTLGKAADASQRRPMPWRILAHRVDQDVGVDGYHPPWPS